ncbi:uncharacterized protein EDB91DRAFT_1255294 [Suillus paluster]|uniref:uncharacterized protein n=1 Tax=Suillus paluster TaxID=48578 RepID=UPI001B86F2BC|nr:uncharacterized protein EDB91DRAFT_1255294 [Suillus paluster]KAG1724327.1 hypothetical protein EDB91DRAFT_1255294 [Suillus paluster]
MADITEPRHTHPPNANKHLGLPDLQGQNQRCSRAKKAEDNKLLQETCEAQEWAAVEGLQQLAAMQEEMKEAEVQSMTKKPKAVKPCARPVKKKAAPPPADKKFLAAENSESRLQKFGQHRCEIKTKKKTKKDTSLIKDAARGSQSGACVEDKKGKSSTLTTNSKFSLAGCIKGWASNIVPDSTDWPMSSASKSHTVASALSLAHGPPSSTLSGSGAMSVSGVTTSSLHKIPPVTANTTEALVGGFGDELLGDSEEHLDAILSKPSAIKIADTLTELTDNTDFEINAPMDVDDNMQTDADNNAPTDADNNTPTDVDSDTPMDADDNPLMEDNNDLYVGDGAHKSENSDSQSSLTFRCPTNQKRKVVGTKCPIQVFKDSSDEDDDIEVLDVDPRLTKPMGSVGTAKTAKKAVHLTSSTSIGISKSSTTVHPPVKKVKTEEGVNDTAPKSTLVALPGHWIEAQ